MPIAEEKALEILAELIKKPESKAEDIPRIWQDIIAVYNQTFAPPEPSKKKRRRVGGTNLGWPAGVSRSEFKAWKENQQAQGVTENLNPHAYKQLREAGLVSAEPAPAPEAPKAARKPAAKKAAVKAK